MVEAASHSGEEPVDVQTQVPGTIRFEVPLRSKEQFVRPVGISFRQVVQGYRRLNQTFVEKPRRNGLAEPQALPHLVTLKVALSVELLDPPQIDWMVDSLAHGNDPPPPPGGRRTRWDIPHGTGNYRDRLLARPTPIGGRGPVFRAEL